MLLVHGIAAHLLLNRKERTTAVLYFIRSLGVTALLNLLKKDRIPYFVCSHDSSPITFNSNALLSKNEAEKKYKLDKEDKDSSPMLYCSGVVTP